MLRAEEWKTYTREVLFKLLPPDKHRIDKMEISIAASSVPFATTDGRKLVISEALIRILDDGDDGEGEYAAILAHEWNHFRKPKKLRPEDVARVKKDEILADEYSLRKLLAAGYDLCYLSRAIEKIEVEPFHMREQPKLWMNDIVLERLSIAGRACAAQRVPVH